MIGCFRFRKLLLRYSEGVLDRRKSEAVRRHVSVCVSCANELAELQSVLTTLRDADIPAAEPAPDLWARVEAAIVEPERRAKPWWQVRDLQMASAAGIAVVVLFAVLAVHLPQNEIVSPQKKETPRVRTGQAALPKKPQSKPKAVVTQPKAAPASDEQRIAKSPYLYYKNHPVELTRQSSGTSKKIARGVEMPKTVERLALARKSPSPAPERAASSAGSEPMAGLEPSGKAARQIPVSSTPAGRAPYSQIARTPGGSQVQVADQVTKRDILETRRTPKASPSLTLPAAPAAPVAGDVSDFFSKGSPAKRKGDVGSEAKVATVPPSIAGSVINVAPSLPLGGTVEGAPPQKSTDKGLPLFGSSSAGYGVRGTIRTTAEDELVKANEQALASHPDSVKTMRWLADAYKRRGQVDKQIRMLEHVAQLCPIDAQNWLSLGEAYEKVKKKEKARDAYNKAIDKGSERIKHEAEGRLKRLEP